MSTTAVRLQKFLADAGISSRREAEEHISSGKVYVNGRKATLGMKVVSGKDRVTFKGKVIEGQERIDILFHKPRGFLCNNDGRREGETIYDAFPELKGLKIVMGLGRTASGLILLSNDGDFLQSVSRQQRDLERVFRVRIQGEIDGKIEQRLLKGMQIDKHPAHLLDVKAWKKEGERQWYEVRLVNYRDSLLEKMFKGLQRPAQRVVQVEFAGIRDDFLKKGKGRILTAKERQHLLNLTEVLP